MPKPLLDLTDSPWADGSNLKLIKTWGIFNLLSAVWTVGLMLSLQLLKFRWIPQLNEAFIGLKGVKGGSLSFGRSGSGLKGCNILVCLGCLGGLPSKCSIPGSAPGSAGISCGWPIFSPIFSFLKMIKAFWPLFVVGTAFWPLFAARTSLMGRAFSIRTSAMGEISLKGRFWPPELAELVPRLLKEEILSSCWALNGNSIEVSWFKLVGAAWESAAACATSLNLDAAWESPVACAPSSKELTSLPWFTLAWVPWVATADWLRRFISNWWTLAWTILDLRRKGRGLIRSPICKLVWALESASSGIA